MSHPPSSGYDDPGLFADHSGVKQTFESILGGPAGRSSTAQPNLEAMRSMSSGGPPHFEHSFVPPSSGIVGSYTLPQEPTQIHSQVVVAAKKVPAASEIVFKDMFSAAFTFLTFTIFSYPLVASVYLGEQINIQYWVGRYGSLALLVPAIFLIVYCIQVTLHTPRQVMLLASSITPCILFMTIGNIYAGAAFDLSDQLLSNDCTNFHSKRELDRHWWTAHSFYMNCLRNMKEKGVPGADNVEALMQVYRIQHCDGYEEAHEQFQTEWDYLSFVEDTHLCTGWCRPGPRLWTFKDTKDACSTAVGYIFYEEVQRTSYQILTFGVIAMVLCAVGYAMGPSLLKANHVNY